MKEIIKMLDEKLEYIKHEIAGDMINIYVESERKSIKCPYCEEESTKVHSRKQGTIQDLPIAGKKVNIVLERRKIFCVNRDCRQKTFTETFEFIAAKSRKTKRLQEEILRISLTQSSVSASKYLRGSVANVGKSTICNMLKKRSSADKSE